MILMNDFKSEPEKIREAMVAASRRVFESGWYVLGSEVNTFERKWADICGVHHGIGVGNGMDAIEISLRSLNIGPGDEVITTPMTAFASVLAILRAGATPVLADIDPDTALLSIDSAKRCLSRRTKAVLLVHLYGQLRSIANWVTFCNENNLPIHPARMNGKIVDVFLEFLTDKGDLVFDPFGGSCITGYRSEELNRRWITIELDQRYAQGSIGRFNVTEK